MLTIIIKDNSQYQQAAIQVVNSTDLYEVLTRNDLLECTSDTMIKKNKYLCTKWLQSLEQGLAVVNPNYLKVSMRIAPDKTILIHTEDNCSVCGQELPN